MFVRKLVIVSAILSAGCASGSRFNDVVVANRRDDKVAVRSDDSHAKGTGHGKARGLTGVPKGHYPPPGECRLWYSGRPPGKQPAPAKCSSLMGRVPAGAFVLYNGKGYDMDYDWKREKKERPGAVPEVIVNLASARKSK